MKRQILCRLGSVTVMLAHLLSRHAFAQKNDDIMFSANLLPPMQDKRIIVKYPSVMLQSKITQIPHTITQPAPNDNSKQDANNNTGNNKGTTPVNNTIAKNDLYYYSAVPNGCYSLENGFAFCSTNSAISSITQQFYRKNPDGDVFFYEKDVRCRRVKFEIIQAIFLRQQPMTYDEYQLLSDYPGLVKLIVYRKDSGDDIAFFLTDKNEIGCLPYRKIKVYSVAESRSFPLHVDKYTLVGPYNDKKDKPDELLLELDGPKVLKYNRKLL